MMEPGRYKARAVEAALGVAKTGTEQIAVAFEITEGPHQGQQITWYGYFTENTTDRTLESLRHCGWSTDDITNLEGLTANEVQLVIEEEQDDATGEMRAKVRWVNKPGGLAMKARMSDADAKRLAARVKGAAVASRAKQGAPSQNGTKHRETRAQSRSGSDETRAQSRDEEIPF